MNKPNPFSSQVDKYWENRYVLFSKFDEGIEIDEIGLYSVQAEKLALEIARTIPGNTILDCFGGVGGNTIAFAREGKKVICVEKDKTRLKMAENNAKVYGVHDKITFINGDITKLLQELSYDWVYFDPPWGGVDYIKKSNFGLKDFIPNGITLLELAFSKTKNIALSLPFNFDIQELNQFPDCIN